MDGTVLRAFILILIRIGEDAVGGRRSGRAAVVHGRADTRLFSKSHAIDKFSFTLTFSPFRGSAPAGVRPSNFQQPDTAGVQPKSHMGFCERMMSLQTKEKKRDHDVRSKSHRTKHFLLP